jgi:hypothetical protein
MVLDAETARALPGRPSELGVRAVRISCGIQRGTALRTADMPLLWLTRACTRAGNALRWSSDIGGQVGGG